MRKLAFLIAFASQVTVANGAEGDLYEDYKGRCFIERTGGVQEQIECSESEPHFMTEEEKAASIRRFQQYEASPLSKEVKAASMEHAANAKLKPLNTYPIEVRRKLAYLKGEKYVTKISFLNDANYPKKYRKSNYYTYDQNGISHDMDATFGEQWTSIILARFLGNSYAKFSPELIAITKDSVTMEIKVSNGFELSEIIAGQKVRMIDHVGNPYEDPIDKVGTVDSIRIR